MDNIFLLSIVEHFPSIMDDPRPLKMCLLGDCKVGKSALLCKLDINHHWLKNYFSNGWNFF